MTQDTSTMGHERAEVQLVHEENGEWDVTTQTETEPLLDTGIDYQPRQRQRGSYPGSEDFDGLPWHKRPSVFWLVGPFLLFTLAFGGVIVPKLNLIVELVCHQYYAEQETSTPATPFSLSTRGPGQPSCHIPEVQQKVAQFTLILQALTGICGAFSTPKLGALSDRYGRVRLLVITSCGGILNEVITILAARFPGTVNFKWLILGAFFDGICGSFSAGGILTNAYASDCSPPSKRGVYIGYLQACIFGGLAFGPLLAAYFVAWTGALLTIFYVTLGCHIAFITFIWFCVPESLSKKRQMLARKKYEADKEDAERRLKASIPDALSGLVGPGAASTSNDSKLWLRFSTLVGANPFAPLRALAPKGRENRKLRQNLILLTAIDATLMSTALGAGTVIVLYTEFMFNWGTFEAGRFISGISLVRVVLLLGVVPALNYVFRVRPLRKRRQESENLHIVETNSGADTLDLWMLRAALLSDCCGLAGYIVSRRPEFFVLSGFVTAVGGLGSATIQGAITKHVPSERVGALLGAIGQIHSLGRVFAPIIFNGIYAATVATFPQAFFVLLLSMFAVAFIFSFFVRPFVYLKVESYTLVPSSEDNSTRRYLADYDALEEEETETLPHLDR